MSSFSIAEKKKPFQRHDRYRPCLDVPLPHGLIKLKNKLDRQPHQSFLIIRSKEIYQVILSTRSKAFRGFGSLSHYIQVKMRMKDQLFPVVFHFILVIRSQRPAPIFCHVFNAFNWFSSLGKRNTWGKCPRRLGQEARDEWCKQCRYGRLLQDFMVSFTTTRSFVFVKPNLLWVNFTYLFNLKFELFSNGS